MVEELMGIVEFNSKKYITSKRLHEELKLIKTLKDTNKSIRNMPTYETLLTDGHLVEVDNNYAKSLGSGSLPLLIKSNSYRPVMLSMRNSGAIF